MWRSEEVFQVQEGVPLQVGSSGSSVLTGKKVQVLHTLTIVFIYLQFVSIY